MQNKLPNPSDKLRLKRLILASVFIVVLIPAVLVLGMMWGDRNYYFTSTIIIILAILPFFLVFESRKPKAREIIPIAVMSAIAVAGRAVFAFLPQFKPVLAIVIITAIAFGAESGFLCGSLSMLVSNMFFGQGPWTPWQMLCCGLIGFIAGLIGDPLLRKNRWLLCGYGFVSAYIYGGIIDIWSILGLTGETSVLSIGGVYVAAIGFNTVLAIATVFFLFVLGKPMLGKLERIKIKYGLYSNFT